MEITELTNQRIDMLIRFFNMKTGSKQKSTSEINRKAALEALELTNGEVFGIRKYIGEHAEELAGKGFASACESFVYDFKSKHQAPAPEVVIEQPAPQPQPQMDQSINFLGQVVVELLAKTKTAEIRDAVAAPIKEELKQFIFDNYGPIQRKVEVQVGEKKAELQGILHNKFDDVLKFVSCDEPVLLVGPAGTGKNVLCKQVAEALGPDFYFSNSVTQEYKINGFTDAMGHYQESEFYKAFTKGGLFMLDEMDASIPEVLVSLNAAIANRYYTFPAPIGKVYAHENFRVIAAANTFGQGATSEYVGRNQLDAASLDRFAMVFIDYDSNIEENLAGGDSDLLKFCRGFRNKAMKSGIQVVVSYRAIGRMAKMSKVLDTKSMLESCLIRSLELDDLNILAEGVRGCGKYTEAFDAIVKERSI